MSLPSVPGMEWGRGSARLRDRAPKLHGVVRDYGQPFTVRRADRPDQSVIGFMWQSKPSGRTDAADPAFTLLGSEVIFLPDAPVLESGFVLIDPENMRVYTPDNDVQDVAGQHVIFWGRFTPYLEHTRADVLVFNVSTGQVTQDPKSGNSIPVVDVENVTVRLAASQDPRVREMVGAEAASLVFVGRWGSLLAPSGRPARIDWGDRAALNVDGQSGILTIELAYPDAEILTEKHFGARFVATWQAAPAEETP